MNIIKLSNVPKESATLGTLFTGPDVTRQPLELDSKELTVAAVNFGKGVRNKFHAHGQRATAHRYGRKRHCGNGKRTKSRDSGRCHPLLERREALARRSRGFRVLPHLRDKDREQTNPA